MDFSEYVGRVIKVDISSGYFYHGKLLEVDDKFLKMIDKNNNKVIIAVSDILNFREFG